jgi:hypothetical protein
MVAGQAFRKRFLLQDKPLVSVQLFSLVRSLYQAPAPKVETTEAWSYRCSFSRTVYISSDQSLSTGFLRARGRVIRGHLAPSGLKH